jgi:hypothetical protein
LSTNTDEPSAPSKRRKSRIDKRKLEAFAGSSGHDRHDAAAFFLYQKRSSFVPTYTATYTEVRGGSAHTRASLDSDEPSTRRLTIALRTGGIT